MEVPVITVDGPSGSGKGTISIKLAELLGWHYLDSGALYRVLALAAIYHNIDLENKEALEILVAHLDVNFIKEKDKELVSVYLEGEEVSQDLRTEKCGNFASKIAKIPEIRKALLTRQRVFQKEPGLVTDGRDMGTVIFPDAKIKVFLDASCEIRAQRRLSQLHNIGLDGSLKSILKEIEVRDYRDRNRTISPLVPAQDALVIDTSDLTIEQVFARVLKEVKANHLVW